MFWCQSGILIVCQVCHKPPFLLWNGLSRGAPACWHKVAVTFCQLLSASCTAGPLLAPTSTPKMENSAIRCCGIPILQGTACCCHFQHSDPEVGENCCIRIRVALRDELLTRLYEEEAATKQTYTYKDGMTIVHFLIYVRSNPFSPRTRKICTFRQWLSAFEATNKAPFSVFV